MTLRSRVRPSDWRPINLGSGTRHIRSLRHILTAIVGHHPIAIANVRLMLVTQTRPVFPSSVAGWVRLISVIVSLLAGQD